MGTLLAERLAMPNTTSLATPPPLRIPRRPPLQVSFGEYLRAQGDVLDRLVGREREVAEADEQARR